ncbi:hypothetical protein EJB05_29482, partial [Eragrostis curvula]
MAAAGVGRLARLRSGGGGKYTQRSINRIRVTLLAAFITFLIVRATIGINRLAYSGGAVSVVSDHAKVANDIERVLREIRADADDLDDGNEPDDDATPSEYHHAGASWSPDYRLGPRVTRWNAKRRRWLHQNPGFPSRNARGNERVLLVTSSSPTASTGGPCATGALGDHLPLRAAKNKLDYCRLHGIDLALHDTTSRALHDELAGGGWSKLPLLRRLMLAHPETEWLWWLDASATVITDMGFDLPLDRYAGSNLVVHGHQDLLFARRSWAAVSTASFLLRNCQWSLDLLDAWATMGPNKGRVRRDAANLLAATLTGRPPELVEADDQSALVHLLLVEKDAWMDKVYIDNEYHLREHWTKFVDKYEDIAAKHHPGYGDDRWPFVTHFVGCDLCSGSTSPPPPTTTTRPSGKKEEEYYTAERCVRGMERALNFADNQVLRLYGFEHPSLQASAEVRRVANRSADPLRAKEEAIAYLKKPKDPPAPKKKGTTREERLERKRLAKRKSTVLARVMRKLGWPQQQSANE